MALLKYGIKLKLQQTSDKKKITPVRCWIFYNNKRVVFASGLIIKPGDWISPKEAGRGTQYDLFNTDIKNVRKSIDAAWNYLTDRDKTFPDELELKNLCKDAIKNNGLLPAINNDQNITLLMYIEQLIADTKSGRRSDNSGKSLAPGTIKHYNSAAGLIKRYLEHAKKIGITFKEIDLQFYYNFRDYAYKNEKLSDNYFGAAVKFLKTVMNEAASEGLHSNTIHNHKRFVKVNLPVENVYLNQDQLEIMFKKDLSDKPKLDRVRDLFLIGAWTGLRFSDFTNIRPGNIDGEFIQIKTQKTGEMVAIPIHQTVRAILNKYQGITENSLPPAISNVKLNKYLKELCEEVGLDEPITLNQARAGKVTSITEPLYKLITTHSARRSFASNMFRMGVPTMIISAITGHRSEKSFTNYIKVSPREKAAIMAEIWQRQAMKIVKEA